MRSAAGNARPRVGVLSLQGGFACHRAALETLGAEAVRVSLPEHMGRLDALVLPGGESTTITRLLEHTGLRAPVEAFVRERPVLGTCAGLILLARRTDPLPAPPLAVLDATVKRNAYGRQVDSFVETLEWGPDARPLHGVFIRAPRITDFGPGVEVVARRPSGEAVGVRAGHVVGVCFHPELTQDLTVHRWFLGEVAGLAVAPETSGDTLSATGGA